MNTKLNDIYIKELHILYDMEHQLVETLPGFAKTATSPDLTKAISKHLEETKNHKERLRLILERHDEIAGEKDPSATLFELISRTKVVAEDIDEHRVRDVFLTASLRKIEKLEKANYQNLIEWANIMDPPKDAYDIDKESLKESCSEKNSAANELYNLAQGKPGVSGLNMKAYE